MANVQNERSTSSLASEKKIWPSMSKDLLPSQVQALQLRCWCQIVRLLECIRTHSHAA